MANVFGDPITDSTLQAMVEYSGKKVTRIDRARVAFNMKTANRKDQDARQYVAELKNRWGNGVSTLCVVYNATGDTITYVNSKDWYGHIGQAPYPIHIQNGQWGAFLHVKTSTLPFWPAGSIAAVVYRGKEANGNDCDYMMAWFNPWDRTTQDNSVCTEIREVNHFNVQWGVINGYLEQSRTIYRDTWHGCLSTISTGRDTSPVVEAIFTLENNFYHKWYLNYF